MVGWYGGTKGGRGCRTRRTTAPLTSLTTFNLQFEPYPVLVRTVRSSFHIGVWAVLVGHVCHRVPASSQLASYKPPSLPRGSYAAEVEARVGLFWRVVAQPLLFGIIGSLVDLRTVSGDVIPRSLALVAIGERFLDGAGS